MNPPPNREIPPNDETEKAPYEPPRITFTEIAVNEALMGICKGGVGSGPYGPGCPGSCRGGGS